jgi:ComF family protein
VFCGVHHQQERAAICKDCYEDLPWNHVACCRCASPVMAQLPEGVYCAACQHDPPPYEHAISPLVYAFPIDAAIKAMKFRRKLFYAPAFGQLLSESMHGLPPNIDALLPVPLHWRRQMMRGFNQASELCRVIQKQTGIPLVTQVIRKRATPYQSRLVAAHRHRNLRDAFAVRGTLQAQHVLIVDDVITTGETCRQLARVLLDAGAQQVSVLAIARA